MKTYIKNLDIRNCWHRIFYALFLICVFFSNVHGENKSTERRKVQAAPTVANPIPDQTVHNGNLFSILIDPYDTFSDGDGDSLSLIVKQADDTNLPTWLTEEEKPFLHLLSTLDTYEARGVTVVGNYAYVADYSSGLKIIDVSNPFSPSLIGSLDTSSYANGITVVGDYAYVADDSSGLKIINIADPANPSLVGSLDTYDAQGVTVVGNYAYVADDSSGLKIINITDPANPSLAGSLDTYDAQGVTVVGNYAYVADGSSGLKIINISDPANPSLVGSLDTYGAKEVTVVGNYAYVADSYLGFKIIDITDPANPSLVGSLSTYEALGLTIVGNYAYVADDEGLKIIDVSDPANPDLAGVIDTYNAYGVTVAGDQIYLADSSEGLKILVCGTGMLLSGTPTDSDIGILNLKVTASDGVAEVFDEFSIDVSNAAPVVVNPIPDQTVHNDNAFSILINPYDTFNDADGDALTFMVKQADDSNLPAWLTATEKPLFFNFLGTLIDTLNYGNAVTVVGNYAYVADGGSGLRILDVTDPANAILVGTRSTSDANDVVIVGNYAYVADGGYGFLRIIDVSDPSSPSLVVTYDTSGNAREVEVVGNYAYVANYSSGLQIINVSDPANPTLVGTYDTEYANSVAIVGNYAYVADLNAGLQIINVSDPANPSLVGTYDSRANAVAVVGNYAYVANDYYGFKIIDISVPSSPSLVSTYDTAGSAEGVTVVGNYAYVTNDESSGLEIIDISDPLNPSLVSTYTSGYVNGIAVVGDRIYLTDDNNDSLKIIACGGLFLSGTPSTADLGVLNLKVTASDDVAEVSDEFSIDVRNEAPVVVKPISNQIAHNGQAFNMWLDPYETFSDPDGDSLSGLVVKQADDSNLPAWLTTEEKPLFLSQAIGTYVSEDDIRGIAVVDDYAYVVIDSYPDGELQILDISNPSTPSLVGKYNHASGEINNVIVVGNYAYIATRAYPNNELRIIDISTPSSPSLVGTYNDASNVFAVSGDYAYVMANDTLQILDISNPLTPSLVGSYDALGWINDLIVIGNYAYVVDSSGGYYSGGRLSILDISNPSSPILMSECDTLGWAMSVAVVGDYAYVADSAADLQIIDVSDPSSSSLMSTCAMPGHPDKVVAVDNYLYVSSSSRLHILDINIPSTPNLIKTYDSSYLGITGINDFYKTMFVGDYAYMVDTYGGRLHILKRGGLLLSGTPSPSDVKQLDLKASINDGVAESSGEFYIDVLMNDAPVVSDILKDGMEDVNLTFTASDFTSKFTDSNGHSLTKVQLVSLPGNGILTLSGADVSIGQEVDIGDLEGLMFEPLVDWYGSTSFIWKGFDGTEYSSNTANVNIQVANDNDAPTVSDVSKSGVKDTVVAFTASDFTNGFSDIDGDALTKIQIIGLSANGTLKLSGVDVTTGQEILEADLNSLTFEPAVSWSGTTSLVWRGFDGVAYSSNFANVNIQIKGTNNPPVVSDVSKSGLKDTTVTFTVSDFTSHFSDFDANSLTKIQVKSLPADGTLKLSGVDVIVNQEIVAGELVNLTFDPATSWEGSTSFSWKGFDGIAYSSNTANVNIQIKDANNLPVVSDISKSGLKDVTVTFAALDFIGHFSDSDGDSLTKIQVVTLPANGTLKLSGINVAVNQEIVAAELANLTFDPVTNWEGSTSFSWKGFDGIAYSSDSANVNIQIQETNVLPVVGEVSKTGTEDISISFTVADFTAHFTDADGDGLTHIQVVTLPANGALKLLDVDVLQSQEIIVGDLNNLSFEPDKNWYGNTNFVWRGHDGFDYSDNFANVNIQVNAVNNLPTITTSSEDMVYDRCDASVAINNALIVTDIDNDRLEGGKVIMSGGVDLNVDSLSFTDRNGIFASYDSELGELTLSGSATIADYQEALRSIIYTHEGNTVPSENIVVSFSVNDGAEDSAPAFRNIAIDDNILSCGVNSGNILSSMGAGTIGGAIIAAGSCALTVTVTGLTLATLYFVKKNHNKKVKTDPFWHDLELK